MNSTVVKILSRTIYLLLLLIVVLVILGSIIISQLDLDNYRYELEQELSTAFEQPVSIGYSNLTFNKGIALRFRDLRIGPEDALVAEIPYLTATLKIAPLLDREIFFDRIELEEPKLQFWFPVNNRPEHGTPKELTSKFGIRILTIRDASLRLHQREEETSREILDLQQLQIELRNWQPNKIGVLSINGKIAQAGQPAEFRMAAKLPISITSEGWRGNELFCELQIDNLSTHISSPPVYDLPSHLNFHTALSGTPAEKAHIEASLTAPGASPLFTMSSNWKSSPTQEAFSDFAGQLLGLPLDGEFHLTRNEQQRHFTGRLETRNIPLSPQLLKRWQVPNAAKLVAGELERLGVVIEKSWPAEQFPTGLPRFEAELTLADLEWTDNRLRKIQDFSTKLSLADYQLEIHDGILIARGQPIFFSGRIKELFQTPQLDLQFNLQTQMQDVGAQLTLPDTWTLSGPLAATLQLSGPLQQPAFLLQTDLSATDLSLGSLLQKRAQHQSSLLLKGWVEKKQLQLERLEFRLPDLLLSGNGRFSTEPEANFFLLDIDPIDLVKLQPLSPLLKKLQLQGVVHPHLERRAEGLFTNLELSDVGAHLNHIVGDLNRAYGQIEIDHLGLRFNNLQARFGDSSFTLSGQMPGWQDPHLDLHLKSDLVHARDLIFRSPRRTLYNLDGQLLINSQGIAFKQVTVQLEEETDVIVTGSLDNFKDPQVKLEIEAKKANIDEVIDLFVGPPKKAVPKHKKPRRPLLITAKAEQGSIGELQFTDAEGLIKDQNGVFTIYPLRFSSGHGYCLARVEFDRNYPESVLKVSGHAEGIVATVLHQDLFKERGLINGALRGDFYLQGALAGKGFWQNAVGGIHLQVEKGTLRKFRGLAQVFSLLNVSQLFSGNLPDMDKEGMPFTLLEGSVRIADGRAYTEDLKINSEAMNMSLIGSQSLIDGSLDYQLGVMPLRTVDKVITSIPIAGWVLAGEDKALLTAHFKIEGPGDSPKVTAIPVSTISETVFGIFKRTLGLPGKLVKDIGSIFKTKPKKKEETE